MQDEELPQPPRRSASRSRLLWAAAVLAALVILAAAVSRIATHPAPQAAPPTVTVPASSGPATTPGEGSPATSARTGPSAANKPPAVLPVLHRLTSAAIDTAHGECPRLASTCTTTGETPAAVGAGLRAAYAGAEHLVAVSDIAYNPGAGPRLAFRRLSAQAGHLMIAVQIRPLEEGDGTGSQAAGRGSGHVVRYQTVAGGSSVEIQISAPGNHYIDLTRMTRLAADTRLFAIG